MVFIWSLSGQKSPQVSSIHILVDLNNAVVWMVTVRPLIFMSSSAFTNPLVTVSNAPITTDISVTFTFHFFFSILKHGSIIHISFHLPSYLSCSQPER